MHDSNTVSPNMSGIRNPKHGLWRDHPATPAQQKLRFSSPTKRQTQAEVLLAMLREARSLDRPLELPEIMAAGIAQHGARFNELRRRGFIVENVTLRDSSGRTRSHYYLNHDPEHCEGEEASK